ncbi:unnamed protein product, partial [Ectocarpus sp. 12 AP-2014]
RSVAVADLNGDGFPDVVVAFFYSDTVTWYRNSDGLGSFSLGVDIATDADGVWVVKCSDVDGDGDFDIISVSASDDRVTWYENTDGEGTFAVGLDISATSLGADMAVAADIDGDGAVDILVASFDDDRVTWFKNTDGEGAFSLGVDLAQDANGAT